MDDKDFVAQMATFSQLEQTMNMASSMDRLVENQTISPVIQYSHMIGKEITYEDVNDDDTKEFVTSEVVSVSQKNGSAIFELENGEKIGSNDITKVYDIKKKGKDDKKIYSSVTKNITNETSSFEKTNRRKYQI